ncbi:MAG: AAA family ATPase [Anaerolineae bacterium]|nr:AAA family ATPase [Anaerolineae bacterium]
MTTKDNPIPHNTEAEEAVLGAILIDSAFALDKVQAVITPEMFYLQRNRLVYEACLALHSRGAPIDFLTVATHLENIERLEFVGGATYLSQLIQSTPSAFNVDAYARMVLDTHKRRQLLDLISDVGQLAFNEGRDLGEAADYIQTRMAELLQSTQQQASFQPFSELASALPEIHWLWEHWIPRGMLSLLGAVPGAGKSMIALDLTKRVLHGLPFPNGAFNPHQEGQPVIYIDGEVVPQLIKERAERWRMDTKNLYLLLPRPNDMIDFSRIEYQELLRQMIETVRPALIVVDSLSSVTSKGENSIEDVRAILGYLNSLATTYQIAILLIHHLRKRSGAQMVVLPGIMDVGIDDFRGSTHITAMARSVMGLSVVQTGPEFDRNGPRKLAVLKTNLCRHPDPVGCELLPLHDGGVMVQWEEKAPEPYKAPTKIDECKLWLTAFVRDAEEPLRPKEIIREATNEGYSRPMVYRARKELPQIQDTDGSRNPENRWQWLEN